MNVDTQWVRDNAGIGEALREVNLLDSEQDCAFMLGAQWHAAGMAVCEFLADLARIYAQCPRCSGFGETMEAPCVVCGTPPDEGCLCALRDVVTP